FHTGQFLGVGHGGLGVEESRPWDRGRLALDRIARLFRGDKRDLGQDVHFSCCNSVERAVTTGSLFHCRQRTGQPWPWQPQQAGGQVMPDDEPTTRGSLQFQIDPAGDLLNSATNVQLLQKLWADRTLIHGDDLGPGDPGDFDYGAWHSSCHLLGAGGVRRTANGRVLWLEIGHDRERDLYFSSVTVRDSAGLQTVPLDSAEGRTLLQQSTLLGFVEG